jgi:hypothetical protein
MADRERIVEVIEEAITVEIWDQPSEARELALEALAALEAAGYAWYRPDDCEQIDLCTAEPMDGVTVLTAEWDEPYHQTKVLERLPQVRYRLVPVGGDS